MVLRRCCVFARTAGCRPYGAVGIVLRRCCVFARTASCRPYGAVGIVLRRCCVSDGGRLPPLQGGWNGVAPLLCCCTDGRLPSLRCGWNSVAPLLCFARVDDIRPYGICRGCGFGAVPLLFFRWRQVAAATGVVGSVLSAICLSAYQLSANAQSLSPRPQSLYIIPKLRRALPHALRAFNLDYAVAYAKRSYRESHSYSVVAVG